MTAEVCRLEWHLWDEPPVGLLFGPLPGTITVQRSTCVRCGAQRTYDNGAVRWTRPS